MSRKVVGRLADAGRLLIGVIALVALVLLSLRGWGRVHEERGDAVTIDGEREGQLVPVDPDGRVDGQTFGQDKPLDVSRPEQEALSLPGVTSSSDASVRDEAGEVEQVATRLLASYREGCDCVLAEAGYLDLLGSVWGCVVQGDKWVDVCVVEQVDEASCRVHVMRLDASDAAEALGVDDLEALDTDGEGDG